MLYLLNVEMPESKCYCVLESDIDCLSKAIHVIDFSVKKQVNVGRRVTKDITVSDISVSRIHSKIYLKDNKFMLEDCGSKFGSLVLAKDPVEIEENTKILQIGRTLLAVNYSKYEKKNSS